MIGRSHTLDESLAARCFAQGDRFGDDSCQLFDLTGRVALVTGGSKGLGKAMARGFAEAGADVVISSRHEEELVAAEAEIRAGTSVQGQPLRRRHDAIGTTCGDLPKERLRRWAGSTSWSTTPAATSRNRPNRSSTKTGTSLSSST